MTAPGAPALTGTQARYLRGLGHHLRPAVVVGREGVTEAVETAVDEALAGAELVKVKVGQGCPHHRKDVAADLAARTGSVVAQVLGRTVLLYRPAKKPTGGEGESPPDEVHRDTPRQARSDVPDQGGGGQEGTSFE